MALAGFYFIPWNQPEPATQIGTQSSPIDIESLDKNERPITDGIRFLKPKSQPSIDVIFNDPVQKDPALRTASTINFEGVADKNVESVTLTSKCYGEFGLGSGTVLRPDGVSSAWKWTISVGASQICRGENLISIRPSTCDKPSHQKPFFEGQDSPKVCWLIRYIKFDSDVAPIHPKTIAITSPKPDDPAVTEQTSVTFEGVAGKDVEKIRVSSGYYSFDWKGGFATVLERPKGKPKDWTWTYTLVSGKDNLVRGRTGVDFNPSTCNTDSYSDACRMSTDYDFVSHAGFLDSKDIEFFQVPSYRDKYFLSSKTVTISGAAGSDIRSIDVRLRCNDADIDRKDTLSKPTSGIRVDGSWEWSYTLDASKQTLCRSDNDLTFTSYPFAQKAGDYNDLRFFSEVGYMPPKLKERVDAITQYETHTIKDIDDVKEDESIAIRLSSTNTQYNTLCVDNSDIGMVMDDATEELRSAPRELMAPKKLDAHLSVQLRLPTESEDKEGTGAGLGVYGTTPVMEFVSYDDSIVPSPLFGWGCHRGATVYYLRPDRIIVNLGQGHESSTVYYLWDGNQWKDLGLIVPVHNPINLKTVNRKMFVVEETRACCDTFYPTVPGGWAQFIYDFDTLEIIDVLFEDARSNY